eukprot:SAG25_NODE_344_length_9418_cov_328.220815_8_plen_88_part_00
MEDGNAWTGWWDGTVDDYDEKCDVWSIGMIWCDLLMPTVFDSCGGSSAAYQCLWDSDSVATEEEGDEGDFSRLALRLGAPVGTCHVY